MNSELDIFINNLLPTDNVAVFTMGRFHPFHRGHHELVEQTSDLANSIRDKVKKSQSFIWVSPTNKEEGWIKYKDNTILKYLNLLHKAKKRKNITPRTIRSKMRNLEKNKTSVSRVNKLRQEINKTEPIPTELRVYFINKLIENLKNKPTILIDYEVNTGNFEDNTNLPTSVRDRDGILYSERVLNYLKKNNFNKVILLVGSDRIEVFKKYNDSTIENLFDDGIIIQSGLDRGRAGEGNEDINKLISEFKKLNIDDKIIETEKAGMYSGSMSRKLANSDKISELKLFLQQINYTDGDDVYKILDLINYIRKVNKKPNLTLEKLRRIIAELNDDKINYGEPEGNPFEFGAFGKMGGKRKRKTRKRKKKRCSKKRLKKKIICHKGTKKQLRKLKKLTKKLKLKLTKCSKKRLKMWRVKKRKH